MSDMPKIGEFCWNELSTPDVEAAKNFYGNVFDWKFSEHSMGDQVYTMIKRNDKEFAGIWAIPKNRAYPAAPRWVTYLLVENLEQSLNKAIKYGASIIQPSTKAGEYGIFAIIQDPTGADLALWQPLKMGPP